LSVVLYMYKEGFRWWNLGLASAAAFLLFLAVVGATALRLYFARRSEV
jgi:multiple sugar transport system permease protein